MGEDQDDVVLMPLKAAQRRLLGRDDISTIYVSAVEDGTSARVKADIEAMMRARRRVKEGEEDNFMVRDMQELAATLESTSSTLTALLGAIAAVSLLVGGIGIMNIMLVSVTERTREIGTRLAIGALANEVMVQFLVEAVIVSMIGGMLGVALGITGTWFLTQNMALPFVMDPQILTIAFSFSAVVGELTLTCDSRLALKEHPYDSTQYGPLNEFGYHFINDLATLPINPPLLFPALPQRIQRLDEARDWLRAQIFSDEPFATLTKVHDSDRAVLMNYTDIQALPSDLLEQFQSDFHNNTNPVTISLNANKQIPSLQGIVSTLGYIDGQAIFERQSSNQTESTYGYPHFHFVMRDNTSIKLQALSFGEQRLFAYHYYLACSPQVVIADELTNGMHHQMVRSCIEAIGQRQAFLATQNPLLLDHLEFTSLESVQESFTLCSRDLIDGEERMTFRQMSDEEAREFFGHYGAEQEHINEILRCLGLW